MRKRMWSGDHPGLQNRRLSGSTWQGCVRLAHASAIFTVGYVDFWLAMDSAPPAGDRLESECVQAEIQPNPGLRTLKDMRNLTLGLILAVALASSAQKRMPCKVCASLIQPTAISFARHAAIKVYGKHLIPLLARSSLKIAFRQQAAIKFPSCGRRIAL